MNDLKGKTALVTGAGRGIGAAIYGALGAAGAGVIGTATGDEGLENIRLLTKQGGFQGEAMHYDAADKSAEPALFKNIGDTFGAPDIVVCNAGVTADTLLIRMKDEDWERVIRTNLSAVFRLARIAVTAMMKKRFGRLIGVSSIVARMGNVGQANYCASKAGMEGFFRAVAKEVAARGVTVNTVAPGFIDTDMTKNLPNTWKEFLIAQTPAKRMGNAEEVAAAVLFLASSSASYITGHTLHVNGGMMMS